MPAFAGDTCPLRPTRQRPVHEQGQSRAKAVRRSLRDGPPAAAIFVRLCGTAAVHSDCRQAECRQALSVKHSV